MKLTIILETGDDNDIQGLISNEYFSMLDMAESLDDLIVSFRAQIQDYIEHEGKDKPEWQNVNVADIQFDFVATLEGLFDTFSFLKISTVAKEAGINPSLLRQYTSGVKFPSLSVAQTIEQTIHRLAQSMLQMQVTHLLPSRVTA
jgi:hypothetical protein